MGQRFEIKLNNWRVRNFTKFHKIGTSRAGKAKTRLVYLKTKYPWILP